MAKRGRNQKKDNRNPKRSSQQHVEPKDMDDDIDIFHKQREIISLDVNDDDDDRESIEDEEEPVFDNKYINDDDDEDEDDSEDGDDDPDETRYAAKIKKQQKYMSEKYGISDNGIHEEEENEEKEDKGWGGRKNLYHVVGPEGDSSDDEALKEEEEEILRMQREKTKTLSIEDFGLHIDEDESERELTLEEISKVKNKVKDSLIEEVEKMDTFEEVKKDLDALSREEQMDVVYSSAPELVGLLSELNDAVEQLESRVNPLLSKVKNGGIILEGGIRYLEVKQLLLLAYCQAITFYLLLKSEGQPVRDHPVIARLVEIKGLLDKMKELDRSLPSEVEELLNSNCGQNKVNGNTDPAPASESVRKDYTSSHASAKADVQEPAEPSTTKELLTMEPSRDNGKKEKKVKHKTDQVGVQSMEMLKLRATLEEKLKQSGAFSSFIPKIDTAQKHSKLVNGQLEAYDDFNDDAIGGLSNGDTSLLGSSKLTQLVSAKSRKRKAVSGDDDLPMRDDIGERRRKHELRVLSGAGVVSEEENPGDELHGLETGDASDMEDGDADTDAGVSEVDLYGEIKQKRGAKLAAKTARYTRNPSVPSVPETVEGKRPISNPMVTNRGLTRQRRKDSKNPRKKYRTKHDKEQKKRWGQVQKIMKPAHNYGGEKTGINKQISRSIRF